MASRSHFCAIDARAMAKHTMKPCILILTLLSCLCSASFAAAEDTGVRRVSGLPGIPLTLPSAEADRTIYLPDADGVPRATTLIPELQNRLQAFLIDARSPIAAVVVAEAKTGTVLAMVQGRDPESWGGKTHTALHPGFPAASLFKTVVTTAALEVADMDQALPRGLFGGCAQVGETGAWLRESVVTAARGITLRRAFGSSCNGFFAKIAVNDLGLGPIIQFARRFGWEKGFGADFHVEKSPFHPPQPQNSSTHTVGRFAAGFGHVGLSAVHAATIMITIANKGLSLPLRLFKDTPVAALPPLEQRAFSETTADQLLSILESSVKGGTATFAFRRGKYRNIRELVGGKTGTLTGSSPRGLTTWFAGIAPLNDPEVVVASVVMLDARWHIKGPNLAAEGLWNYFDLKNQQQATNILPIPPVTKNRAKMSRR